MVKDFCFSTVRAPVALSYFTAGFSLLLTIVTTIGNALIFVAVYKDPYKRLRNPFCYFLLSLAASDFIVGTVTLPVSFWFHWKEAVNRLEEDDKVLLHLTFFITSTASVLSMAALCFDRYMAVQDPIEYRKKLSYRRCAVIAACIWTFSVGLSMSYFVTDYILLLMICVHTSLAVTLGMMILTYRKVYIALNSMAFKAKTLQQTDKKEKIQEKKKRKNARREKIVTRTFLTLLLLFFGCYFPVVVMIYILQFCTQCSCTFRHILRDLEFVIICANSAVNPVACVVCLRAYRESVLVVLRCANSESYSTDSSKDFESESHSASKRFQARKSTSGETFTRTATFLSPSRYSVKENSFSSIQDDMPSSLVVDGFETTGASPQGSISEKSPTVYYSPVVKNNFVKTKAGDLNPVTVRSVNTDTNGKQVWFGTSPVNDIKAAEML